MRFTLLFAFLVLSVPNIAAAERIWQDSSIPINKRGANGQYVWATLDRNDGCYQLIVGSETAAVSGVASACDRRIRSYTAWFVRACGYSNTFQGTVEDMVDMIVGYCW